MKLIFSLISISILTGCASSNSVFEGTTSAAKYETMMAEARKKDEDERKQKEQKELERKQKLQACQDKSKESSPVSLGVLSKIQESVKEQLKDPLSASFKNVRVMSEYETCVFNINLYHIEFRKTGVFHIEKRYVSNNKNTLYIGDINAKNSYGGYVGYKPFISDSLQADISTGLN